MGKNLLKQVSYKETSGVNLKPFGKKPQNSRRTFNPPNAVRPGKSHLSCSSPGEGTAGSPAPTLITTRTFARKPPSGEENRGGTGAQPGGLSDTTGSCRTPGAVGGDNGHRCSGDPPILQDFELIPLPPNS